MANKKIGILALVLCFCICLMSYHAQAANTADAVEPILPEKPCTLTISYCYDGTGFADVQVKLYQIATVSAQFSYTLTPDFEASGLNLNGIQTAGEWNVIRSTLEAYILVNGVAPDAVTTTDQAGNAGFDALQTGLYLAVVEEVVRDQLHCCFDSAMIALPGLGTDGHWQYEVSVEAKGEALPPIEPDETIEMKVLKLWKGDEDTANRPQSVEVEIFRDGVSYETVVLSETNHWSYSWSAKDDGATWLVVERNVPEGYVMTMEQRGDAFVLTNTLKSDDPINPDNPPETGDTFNVLFCVLLMAISGSALVILGLTEKRKNA